MNRSTFWATVAQVIPVLMAVITLEVRFTRKAPLWFRAVYAILIVLMGWSEYRAFEILGSDNEWAADARLAKFAIGSGVAFLVAGGLIVAWRRD